ADRFNGPQAVNTSDDGRFISGLYHDLLGRSSDVAGFLGQVTPVDQTRLAVVGQTAQALVTSPEGRGVRVLGYLVKFLRRPANTCPPSVVNGFVTQLQQGASEESIIAQILALPEYFAINGGTNDKFVDAMYKDVLNGQATAFPTKQQIKDALNNMSLTPLQAASILLNTPEYRTTVIVAAYTSLMGRQPAASDTAFAIGVLTKPPTGAGTPNNQ